MLGPLFVKSASGWSLCLKRPKHRQLLAALLLRPNATVASGLLIDYLWGERAPKSARGNLKTYIWQLRGMLAALDHGRARIETTGNGYQITVRPDELDTLSYQQLTQRGDQAHRRGDAAAAEVAFSQALNLWRGEVLQGQTLSEPLSAWARILAEDRLRVLEELAEVRIALGRHAETIGPLRRALHENPLRERLWAQLMLALYRDGRSSDALLAYQDLRLHLITEIGTEPGPAVRRLHQRILAADPGLDGGCAPTALDDASPRRAMISLSPPDLPAQLPSDAGPFVGRDGELTALTALLSTPGTGHGLVAAIDGPCGVGKSRLAVHAAHAVASAYPDGQLYADLHGTTAGRAPLPPDEALARFLRALNVPDTSRHIDEAAALFRTQTAGRRMLIVLDNAVDAAQVRPLLPGGSASAVLVTSRARLTTLDATTRLHLDLLGEREATDLLAAFAGPERVRQEPQAAARIVELCDRLPLAVRVAGARLADNPHWPVTRLAARLTPPETRLAELRHGDLCVRARLTAGHELDHHPAAGDLFELLGLLDLPEVTAPVVASLTDGNTDDIQPSLDALAQARLLESHAPDRYHMRPLIRLFARAQSAHSCLLSAPFLLNLIGV
ncbi:AfsR/SARP family transcriptional regulator [Acrocarpospora catenulata]|uniref:AfsR/SARP family transcriptional regulator n=1 Tax=Acrocarpospora catenulata TaxID=2836182 RepID=UPI001BDA1B5A|nr:BTAD domain-containing putative transcriptional regulator [Acrocarpospora catenulata]